MDKKAIIGTVVAVIITFMVTYALTSGQDVVEAGIDAQTEAVIKRVINEQMRVDIDGETKTYGQVLSSMHTKLSVVEAQVAILTED